ncbi:MAG: glycosyltransferase family 2 protein [Victivallaceae bacterium]|nr:glycosyltransferase family 2 protein [Victivallaceae bacterium]
MSIISIIIPVYNVEKYLFECLNSVLNQTFSDFECICVNDGSIDGSAEILRTCQKNDSRIKIIHDANHGQGHARNIGMEAATGKYIVFIDSDDFISADYLDNLYNAIKTTGSKVVCNDNVMIYHYPGKQRLFTRPHLGMTNMSNKLLREAWAVSVGKIYSREFLIKIKVKFQENCKFEDAYFFYVVFCNLPQVYYINSGIYYYRQHSDSTMAVTAGPGLNNIDVIYVVKAIYDYLINSNYIEKYAVPVGMLEYNFNRQRNKKQLFVEIKKFILKMQLKPELYIAEELKFINLVLKSGTLWPLLLLYWQKRLHYYIRRLAVKLSLKNG